MSTTRWALPLLLATGCFSDPGGGGTVTAGSSSLSSSSSSSSADASTSTGVPTTGAPTTGDDTTGTSTTTGDASDTGPTSTTGPADGDPCDPWDPRCPAGSKCAPWADDGGNSWNANKCVPAGDRPPGLGCTVEGSATSGLDTCQAGAMCWDVDPDTLAGVCVAQCQGSPQSPACNIGSACYTTNLGSINLCIATCDPLEAKCDGVCVFDGSEDQFICLPDASGRAMLHDACEFSNGCPPGSACANAALSTLCAVETDTCCLAYCDLTVADVCGADQECLPFFDRGEAPPDLENVGLCISMM